MKCILAILKNMSRKTFVCFMWLLSLLSTTRQVAHYASTVLYLSTSCHGAHFASSLYTTRHVAHFSSLCLLHACGSLCYYFVYYMTCGSFRFHLSTACGSFRSHLSTVCGSFRFHLSTVCGSFCFHLSTACGSFRFHF